MHGTLKLDEKVAVLKKFYQRERRLPGYNEMLGLFGYHSKNAVHKLVMRMVEAGYLIKRGPKIAAAARLAGGLRLLGNLQAGFPSLDEQQLLDVVSLDELLIRNPETTFMLTVTDDAMSAAGICKGDLVLVERDAAPQKNDIVVAMVDGEWTIQYYRGQRDGVGLASASRYCRSGDALKRSLTIGGVVRTLIRQYDDKGAAHGTSNTVRTNVHEPSGN
ncbi:MAG: S24 family peptidase [bacterium]